MVSGGSTGMAVQLANLRVFAAAMRDTGGDLLALSPKIAGAALDDDVLAAALICPDIVPGVVAAVTAAQLGPDGVLVRGAAIGTVGVLVEASAFTYEAADAAGAALLDQVQTSMGFGLGLMLPGLLLTGAGAAVVTLNTNPQLALMLAHYVKTGEMSADLQQFLFEHPEVTELLTRSAPGLIQGGLTSLSMLFGVGTGPMILSTLAGGNWPTTDYQSALAGLIALGQHGGAFVESGDYDLVANRGSRTVELQGVGDIFDLQGSMNAGQPTGEKDKDITGQIRVVEVTKNGVTSLVVQVPGTEEWSPMRGSNPVDLTTNVQAMALQDTVMRQKVIEAIKAAQLKHPGAEVMLTGHSQGGIVAATLASDPTLVRDLHIKGLVTGGSPIGRMPIDPSVSVLAVEHTQDPVPMLDGTANPDRANWTTVRQELSSDQVLGKDSGRPEVFNAHGTQQYVSTGNVIDASKQGGLVDWREANSQFFGGTATSTVYDLVPTK